MNQVVAKTILEQLGGNKFVAMTGAKDFVGSGDMLMFKIGRNKTQANKVIIKYDVGRDLYNIQFLSIRTTRMGSYSQKEVAKHDGVYCDMLQEIFTNVTGLYTSL